MPRQRTEPLLDHTKRVVHFGSHAGFGFFAFLFEQSQYGAYLELLA